MAEAARRRIDADIRQGLIARMGDVSIFMKELKQRFSLWYNRHHDRFGTLWAERFKSVVKRDHRRVHDEAEAAMERSGALAA